MEPAFTYSVAKLGRRLYEIPITLPLRPSRKAMRAVALHSVEIGQVGSGIRCKVDPPRSADPQMRCACTQRNRSTTMLDILMLALGFGFFAVAIGYAYVCERL